MHTFCHIELYTFKNLDFQKTAFAFFNLESLISKHSQSNMGQHIDLKSSLSQNLKSFVCKKGPKVIVLVMLKLHFEFKTNPIVL